MNDSKQNLKPQAIKNILTEEAIRDKVDCWLYGTDKECSFCSRRKYE